MTTALHDADVICYRASAVSAAEVDWDGEGEVPLHNLPMAKEIAVSIVDEWSTAARAKRCILIFSDRTAGQLTFRHRLCATYKMNRAEEKPPLHNAVAAFLRDHYKHLWIAGLEGDDTLGLMGTGDGGSKYTLVSIDKDMLTLPCRQVNPYDIDPKTKKPFPPHKVSLKEADYNWMFQAITGDTVDNYKGAPGAGKVAAEKALSMKHNRNDMWSAVLEVHARQYDHPTFGAKCVTDSAFEEALMTARCARILRFGDYEKGMVRLWHPNDDEAEWVSAV